MNDGIQVIRPRRRAWPARTRTVAAIMAIVGLAVLAVACGAPPGGHAPSAEETGALAFSHCMRSHGVTSYPDPNGGGELPKESPQQLGISSSQYQAATQACARLLPNSGGITPAQAQEIATDEAKFIGCMHSHGVPNWPDPVLDRGRLVFDPQVVGIDPNSPQISTKIQECDRVFPASLGVPPGAGSNP